MAENEVRESVQEGGYERSARDLPPGEAPPTRGPGPASDEEGSAGPGTEGVTTDSNLESDTWLIQKAQEMYNFSTDYLDANITNYWERNLAHFNNEHAPGSAYRRKGFKRSRVFRPRTRSNIKQQESGLANALFSTSNLISVGPQDETNQLQSVAAAVTKVLMDQRLQYRMPWFLTVQGAYQNTKVYGLCVSHQYWAYEETTKLEPAYNDDGSPIEEPDPETGEMMAMGRERVTVLTDELRCDLIAPENFRFDPMCDWRDPAGTSPYLIYQMPIYVNEATEMMKKKDPKTGKKVWRKYGMAEILATRRKDYDRTRQAREGRQRIDPADEQRGNEFTTVWAHMNILQVEGVDYVYWTMGTELVLTDPVPLLEEYPWLKPGERPFVVGYSTIEAHRNYPSGDVEQSAPIQEEINTVANQRLDNVKLVLNKRYFLRRGSQVDLDALIRNVPGGGVMMNDPEKDVQVVNTPDVTGSSYNEQQLLGQEMDSLVGGFDAASANVRQSVSGQQLAGASAGAVQDYGITIFRETWIEPVLRQLQRLIAMYETDDSILMLAGRKANAFVRLGTDEITDNLMLQNLVVAVDVGMGNTDPMRKVERLVFGTGQVAQLPGMQMRIKPKPIADAIFGALGYRDSNAFIMTDEEYAQWQEQNPPGPSEIDVKMRELEIREADNNMRDERERMKIEREAELKADDMALKQDQKLDELAVRYGDSRLRNQTQRDLAGAKMISDMVRGSQKPSQQGGANE